MIICETPDAGKNMPELPEVETVVRGLRPTLTGRQIVSVRLGKTDFIDDPAALEAQLPGCRIADVARVGKFIELRLSSANDGGKQVSLFVHLGMTGRLLSQLSEEPEAKHTHVVLSLDDGRELRYTDARRFGRFALVLENDRLAFQSKLGAEPLEISVEQFSALVKPRRAMTKALLLDQRMLRGIGNIYADEALWRARIHPKRLASKLTEKEIARLLRSIQRVLAEAIRLRGSSISDFVDSAGEPGEFQLKHRVYGREGKGCFRCGTRIQRVIVVGRSSHFCPKCQTWRGTRKRA